MFCSIYTMFPEELISFVSPSTSRLQHLSNVKFYICRPLSKYLTLYNYLESKNKEKRHKINGCLSQYGLGFHLDMGTLLRHSGTGNMLLNIEM
jgi:hypothetical protein